MSPIAIQHSRLITLWTCEAKRFKTEAVCSFVWPEKHIYVREQPQDNRSVLSLTVFL